jgi:MFS family permease
MENNQPGLWTPNFIAICIAHFLLCFSIYMLLSILPFYIVERFHADKTTTGLILSCYVMLAIMVRPFSGYLVDTFRRKPLYLLSFAFFVSLYLGYLLAAALAMVTIVRMLQGIAWGMVTVSANTLAIDIMPPVRRGEGVGYFGMTLNLSMAAGPVVGLFLYEFYSFESIFYVTIVSGAAGLIVALFIKAPRKARTPQRPISLDRFIMTKGIPIAINLVSVAVSYGMIISFAAMYGKEMNISNAGMFFTLYALGIGGARIIGGKLTDRNLIHELSLAGMIILSASFVLLTFARTGLMYFLSALFIGIGFGILIPAFQTMFINMAHHNQRGTATSMYLTSFDLGIGLGMIAAGKIASMCNLSTAFGCSALINMVAVFYYWCISKKSYNKNKLV